MGDGDFILSFFANLPPFGAGVVFASFAFCGGTAGAAGASTGLACSTRTSSFCAGGGAAAVAPAAIGTWGPVVFRR